MNSHLFSNPEDFKLKRKRQIDTLKVFNDNVQEVQAGVDYRVEFWASSCRMAVLVHLGSDFPLERPVLSVSPNVSHPWVDHSGRVTGAPGLLNYTQHSDLGRVVHAIVREFELRPPTLLGQESVITSALESNSPIDAVIHLQAPPIPISGTQSYHQSANQPYQQPSLSLSATQPFQQPSISATQSYQQQMVFPELAEMSVEELRLLLNSAERRNDFLDKLPASRELDEQLEQLMVSTETLAKENLSKQGELGEAHAACEERRQKLSELHKVYEGLSVQFQALADRRTPASIRESLRAATHQADEESERVAEHFLSGGMTVDQFLVAYINKRMMSHTRRIKEEKLSQQLRDLLKAGY